jgi:hypothetical protein
LKLSYVQMLNFRYTDIFYPFSPTFFDSFA